MDDADIEVRQRHSGVTRGDGLVIPFANFAQVNIGEHRAGEAQLSGQVGQVVGGDDCAQGQRNMDHFAVPFTSFRELGVVHGGVGAAEIEDAVDHVVNTAARADPVI